MPSLHVRPAVDGRGQGGPCSPFSSFHPQNHGLPATSPSQATAQPTASPFSACRLSSAGVSPPFLSPVPSTGPSRLFSAQLSSRCSQCAATDWLCDLVQVTSPGSVSASGRPFKALRMGTVVSSVYWTALPVQPRSDLRQLPLITVATPLWE